MKRLILLGALFFAFALSSQAQTVYSSAKGEKYHTADCKHSGNAEAIELSKAKKAGKKSCEVCKPDVWVKTTLNQCTGKTKDGTRCKRMTANTNKKCFQHQRGGA